MSAGRLIIRFDKPEHVLSADTYLAFMHSTTLTQSELDSFHTVVMHLAPTIFPFVRIVPHLLVLLATMPSNCISYDFMSHLSPTDRLVQCGRLYPLIEAEVLLFTIGRNVNSYAGFIGSGDTGRAVASSYYIHNKSIAEHAKYSPLATGEDFRDPPIYIDVREGHAPQLPEENATIKAYDELRKMGLTLQQQEYGKRNQGSICFPTDHELTSVRSSIHRGKSLWTPSCTLLPTRSLDQLASEVQGNGLE